MNSLLPTLFLVTVTAIAPVLAGSPASPGETVNQALEKELAQWTKAKAEAQRKLAAEIRQTTENIDQLQSKAEAQGEQLAEAEKELVEAELKWKQMSARSDSLAESVLDHAANPAGLGGFAGLARFTTKVAIQTVEATDAKSDYELRKATRDTLVTERRATLEEIKRLKNSIRNAKLEPVYDRHIAQLQARLEARQTSVAEEGRVSGKPTSAGLAGSAKALPEPTAEPNLAALRQSARDKALASRALQLGEDPGTAGPSAK